MMALRRWAKYRRLEITIHAVWIVLLVGWIAATYTPYHGYELMGSSLRHIAHRDSCEWAKKIHPANLVMFADPEEAREAGYRPCKVCKPFPPQ